jgi:2-methylcitrate dehydratase
MIDPTLNHLCDYALKLSYRDLPEEVIRRTKHIILDTVGCALGGAESPPAKIARASAAEITSAVPSSVLVSGRKTSPDLAAFVNGVMIRYLDFNDTYAGSPTCHPSDLLAPVLAVVDAANGSGKDVILGMGLAWRSRPISASSKFVEVRFPIGRDARWPMPRETPSFAPCWPPKG